MKTLEDVLEMLEERIDRPKLEKYIVHEWVRPVRKQSVLYFEDIDIARLQLVYHLSEDIEVNDDGMDIVLSLLDQMYHLRTQMKNLTDAITCQSPEIKSEVISAIRQFTEK